MKTILKCLVLFCCLPTVFSSCDADLFYQRPDVDDTVDVDGDLWWVVNSTGSAPGGIVAFIISGDWTTPGKRDYQVVSSDEGQVGGWSPWADSAGRHSNGRFGVWPPQKYTVENFENTDGTTVVRIRFGDAQLSSGWYFENNSLVLKDSKNEVFAKYELKFGREVESGTSIRTDEPLKYLSH